MKTLESSCITTLVEGSVQMITAQRDSVKLSPGQQALVVNDGSIEVRKVNTRYYTGWMNDFFAFKDVTLRDIMDVLADWYGCTCRFENRELEEMLYTAIVKRSESIDSVLQVLSGTGDFRYARINNVVIIKEK